MFEMHLRQPAFTCRAWESFTKNIEQIQKFKEAENSTYIFIEMN